jgi:protease I
MTITYIATGGWIKFDRLLENTAGDDYDVVIIPGGAWNPDTLRVDVNAIGSSRKPLQRARSSPRSATARG